MLSKDNNKLNKLEGLKSKLSSNTYKVKFEHRDSLPHFPESDTVDSWEEGDPFKKRESFFARTSIFKKFFIFSIAFFLLAVSYALYTVFIKGNTVSNDKIDISVLSNAFASGGEEYSLQLTITNKNSSALQLADLVVEYPKTSEQVQNTTDYVSNVEHMRISLGTIPAGSVKNESVKFVLFGEQGSSKELKISLEYRVEGSNAIFVKEKTYDISISSTPVNLSVDAPNEISTSQPLSITVKASLNAIKPLSGMLIKVDYPIGFQFDNAVPSPSIGNNIWSLGDFAPGAERNIVISGKMIDVSDGEQKVFKVWSGSQSSSDKSNIDEVYNSLSYNLLIQKPGIEARLFVNGVYQSEYAVDTRTSIVGQINWANNLETNINDMVIVAKLYGNAFDRKNVDSKEGFYDSSKNTITWDRNTNSGFAEVNPGDSGTISFSLSSLSLFSASGVLSFPTINIDVSVTGKQSGNGGSVTKLNSAESKVIRLISDVGLSSKALHFSGPFENTGPIPPKADQKTTYTIVWTLSNTANNISKTKVTATLPSWVHFKNKFSPSSENLSYDSSTGQIVWNVANLQKGTGITETGRSVSFQVEFSPSLSQVGTNPIILNDTVLTGHDDFANVDVRVNKASLNTRLLYDTGFPVDGDRVVE